MRTSTTRQVIGSLYGWIWGPNDEIGALNAITPAKVTAALKIPTFAMRPVAIK